MGSRFGAGWSSPVARQAHNLKVVGSNPTPATKKRNDNNALAPPRALFAFGPQNNCRVRCHVGMSLEGGCRRILHQLEKLRAAVWACMTSTPLKCRRRPHQKCTTSPTPPGGYPPNMKLGLHISASNRNPDEQIRAGCTPLFVELVSYPQ